MRPANLLGALLDVQSRAAELADAERDFERAKVTARDLGATEDEIQAALVLVDKVANR